MKAVAKKKPGPVVVEGLGDTDNAGAVLSAPDWQGVVFLRPWRIVGGPIRQDRFRVLLRPRRTSELAMRDADSQVMGAAYRIKVERFPEIPNTLPSGQLVGRITRVKALPELAGADDQINRDFEIVHPELGRLRRAPRSTELEGRVAILGTETTLIIAEKLGAPVEVTASRASVLLKQVKGLLPTLPQAIAQKMLPLANGNWLEPGSKPWSRDAFLRLLEPTLVSVDENAREVNVSFNCGGAFTDHGIAVTVVPGAVRHVRLQ